MFATAKFQPQLRSVAQISLADANAQHVERLVGGTYNRDAHISFINFDSQPACRHTGGAEFHFGDEPDIASALQGSLQDCQHAHAYLVEAGLTGDTYLLNLVLRAYSKLGTMSDARSVFDAMPRPSIITWNTIISGYVNCNALDEARSLFNRMPQRNVVSWNTLITAYAHQEKSKEALHLFERLYQESELPNDVTFLNILIACSKLAALKSGRFIHSLICGCRLESSMTVGTMLISMYAKCNALASARDAFHQLRQHDVASWTSLISAYAQGGNGEVALNLYQQMQQEGVQPNKLTILSILSAIAKKKSFKEGKALHACMCFGDLKLDVDTRSALINMYGKCGSIGYAWFVFEDVKSNAISIWNAMIAACVGQKYFCQALSLYNKSLQQGLRLNEVTFANVLSASTLLLNLNIGVLTHSHLVEEGHMLDVVVNNTLITFYSRCKALEEANSLFKTTQIHSVVTWTCMISAYAQEGLYQQALELFQQMQIQQVRPNDLTIVTALVACADSIALEEGRRLHAWIALDRNELDLKVINGMLNMYGKCGALMDAFSVFTSLGDAGNIVSWNSMVNGFAYGGYGEAAFASVYRMLREGIQPDEFTFVGVLSACSHAGMVDAGIFCFYYVVHNFYKLLLLEHCICIVDLFGRAGQLADAQSLVCKVPFLPDASLWSALQAVCRMHSDSLWEIWMLEHILEVG